MNPLVPEPTQVASASPVFVTVVDFGPLLTFAETPLPNLFFVTSRTPEPIGIDQFRFQHTPVL